MPVAPRTLVLQIADDENSGVLVGYSDAVLDYATRLVISHRTCNLSAEVVENGERMVFRCGRISSEKASRLKNFKTAIWARLEGNDTIAVVERPLEHV